jgi:hypothetical protein
MNISPSIPRVSPKMNALTACLYCAPTAKCRLYRSFRIADDLHPILPFRASLSPSTTDKIRHRRNASVGFLAMAFWRWGTASGDDGR